MFAKLLSKIRSVGKQTRTVWCVSCKDYTISTVVGYRTKGTSTRMLGTCCSCTAATSTFVASA
jgi:hypothetical protein